jgi:hypothetical protein
MFEIDSIALFKPTETRHIKRLRNHIKINYTVAAANHRQTAAIDRD